MSRKWMLCDTYGHLLWFDGHDFFGSISWNLFKRNTKLNLIYLKKEFFILKGLIAYRPHIYMLFLGALILDVLHFATKAFDRGFPTLFPSEPFYIRNFRFFPHFLGRDRDFCRDILGNLGQLNHREKSEQPVNHRAKEWAFDGKRNMSAFSPPPLQ